MLVVETITRIRREHRDGKPIKAIARDLRLSRNTVRKAVRAPDADAGYKRKEQHRPQTGPLSTRLEELLEENEGLPRRDRLRMTRIHDLLQRKGFGGSYDAVRRYAARWKRERRVDAGDMAKASHNMKTAVTTVFVGKEHVFNRRFLIMTDHYRVEPVA